MEKHTHSEGDDAQASMVSETTNIAVGFGRKDLFLPISILAAALMVGGAIVFATLYKPGVSAPAANSGNTPTAQNGGDAAAAGGPSAATLAQAMTIGSRDAILGSANAPVTLIEYGDYQCPFCAQFFSQTEPQIIQNYVNTGKVKMVFRNFAFLGAESTAAAEAADCAEDQNKLWPYHDALYSAKVADEQKGGGEDDGFYNRAEFLKLAQQVGLDIPTFTSCIDNNTHANDVAQEKTDGTNVGINSTPSFLINGQLTSGAQPYSVFQQALDAALK